jgi:hypothetical protein
MYMYDKVDRVYIYMGMYAWLIDRKQIDSMCKLKQNMFVKHSSYLCLHNKLIPNLCYLLSNYPTKCLTMVLYHVTSRFIMSLLMLSHCFTSRYHGPIK